MKDIDELKHQTTLDLRTAKDQRQERDARAARDRPILDALAKMERDEQVLYTPGPKHATRVVNIRRDAAEVKLASAEGRYVYVGRPSIWGNPFSHLATSIAIFHVPLDQVLPRYEEWLLQQAELMAALGELRGKVLGCWCRPRPCHGDILARLADQVRP